MPARRSLGRPFRWLWGAYAVSTLGTWLAFDAFPLIAILVLHTGPTGVSMLTASGLAVGAVVAIPVGPWIEGRPKRPVMMTMDVLRFVALMSVPAAFILGALSFTQLLVVAIIVAAADITFKAASGTYVKTLVPQEDLLLANSRFESTTWTATMLGRLGFTPWQYGLAFAVPCAGGLIGSRFANGLVARFGQRKIMLATGTLRACWSLGLAFIGPDLSGLLLVMAIELGLITCCGVFNPVFASYRLEHTATDRVTRTLSAWSVTSKAIVAAMTALGGILASVTSPRTAIAIAGVVMLGTPALLFRKVKTPVDTPKLGTEAPRIRLS